MLASSQNYTKFYNTGCFGQYSKSSCVRDSCLTLMAIMTGIVCIVKVYKLHRHHHSLPNQYIIFYSGIVESVICALNWLYLDDLSVEFAIQFLKIVQCLIVCRFHCELAARVARRDRLSLTFALPVLVVLFMYTLAVTIAGIVTMKKRDVECLEPEWLLLSSAEFAIVQFFLVSGIFITRKLNLVRTVDNMRNSQKRDLWIIIMIFEISALVGVIHDVVLRITGPGNGCHGVLLNDVAGYTGLYLAVKICRWLIPVWAMAAIFSIEENERRNSSQFSGLFSSGNLTSEFRPRGSSFHYKHLQPGYNATSRLLSSSKQSEDLSNYGSTVSTSGKLISPVRDRYNESASTSVNS